MGGWGGDDDEPLSPEATRRAERAATNSVRLTQATADVIVRGLADPSSFTVTIALLGELNAIAVEGEPCDPGVLQRRDVQIGSAVALFAPPPWHEVHSLLVEAIDHVNAALAGGAGHTIHAAADARWRINWIYPFGDGNGRTARALCDGILCVGFGRELPGTLPIHEQISSNHFRHWDALQAADRAWNAGALDVSEMESLLSELLEKQLGIETP